MRQLLLFMAAMLITIIAFSQITPMEYLNAIPKPPVNLCASGIEEKTKFQDEMQNFNTAFTENAERESEASEQFQEEHQDEQTISALMKQGYTREEAEKMKNLDNMSEAEQMAMANQMMQRNYNMDMTEAQKVATYDSATQQRWAKAQSTIMMSEAQMDPDKNTKKQLEIKSDLELQQEAKWLQDKLIAGENKYSEMLRKLDVEADSARSEMNPEIDKLYKDLTEGNGNSDQIIDRIISLRQIYCEKFTPRYLQIIDGYKGYVADHFQDYFRLEELQMKLAENQGMLKDPNYKPGKLAMGKVGSYANMIKGIFKYNLNAEVGSQFIGY
jgi:hypothetical protein